MYKPMVKLLPIVSGKGRYIRYGYGENRESVVPNSRFRCFSLQAAREFYLIDPLEHLGSSTLVRVVACAIYCPVHLVSSRQTIERWVSTNEKEMGGQGEEERQAKGDS
jgi:hypothetical protein